ncbi:MAG: hypothetical protein OXR84_06160 [Magnetovibrio sp.]|nr:hypothetical protein [Magnetovibrio sp.]
MPYSLDLKRAAAAAAVTRLAAGRRNLNDAAAWVAARVGDAVYPTQNGKQKAAALLDFRKKVLGYQPGKRTSYRLAIARFHYDNCLKWANECGLGPEDGAATLIETLSGKAPD